MVTYTVRLENDGTGDYTAASPASVVDDLTAVSTTPTSTATANAQPGSGPGLRRSRGSPGPVRWQPGTRCAMTYEVVLTGGGDGKVRNVAWAPLVPGNPGPTPDCADPRPVPCGSESFDLPKLTIDKTRGPRRPAGHRTGRHLHRDRDQPRPRRLHRRPPGDVHRRPVRRAQRRRDLRRLQTADRRHRHRSAARPCRGPVSWTTGEFATITYAVTYRGHRRPLAGQHRLRPRRPRPRTRPRACDTVSVPGSGLVHAQVGRPRLGHAGRGRRQV